MKAVHLRRRDHLDAVADCPGLKPEDDGAAERLVRA